MSFNLSVLLITFSIQMIKGKIVCGEHLISVACYTNYYIPGDKTISFVKACPKGYFCDIENSTYKPSCAKRIIPSGEGGKCYNNIDCAIGACQGGKCKIIKDGGICIFDEFCTEKSICNDQKICAPMSRLGEPCNLSTDCLIGLECINNICLYIATGENGDLVNTEKGCISGFTISKQFLDGKKTVCATFLNASKCDNSNNCYGNLDDGEKIYTNYSISCKKNWENQYICPSERGSIFLNYIDSFVEGLLSVKDIENNRITNRYTLNNPTISSFFLDYEQYYNVYGADDCVRFFFYRNVEFSEYISYFSSFYILIILF